MKIQFIATCCLVLAVVLTPACKKSEKAVKSTSEEASASAASTASTASTGSASGKSSDEKKDSDVVMKDKEVSTAVADADEANVSQEAAMTEQQAQVNARPAPKYPDSLFFRIERTPCFGQCPVYTVDIFQSGRAVLDGKEFFDFKGTFQTRFSAEDMHSIVAQAEQQNYFNMAHVYDAPVTDLPSTTTILVYEEYRQWVYNRMNSPKELRAFESWVEQMIKSKTWTPLQGTKP